MNSVVFYKYQVVSSSKTRETNPLPKFEQFA